VLGWGAYGTVCAEFLWGKKGGYIYKLIFSAVCVLGAVISVEKIWIISETLNSLVFIPNIIIVYLLF
jgi:AGCS family alanine or glycine:cation symporter